VIHFSYNVIHRLSYLSIMHSFVAKTNGLFFYTCLMITSNLHTLLLFGVVVSSESLTRSILDESVVEPRIVGGEQAQSGRYPFVVSLTRNSVAFCGGEYEQKQQQKQRQCCKSGCLTVLGNYFFLLGRVTYWS
jgi:hypothetical protein